MDGPKLILKIRMSDEIVISKWRDIIFSNLPSVDGLDSVIRAVGKVFLRVSVSGLSKLASLLGYLLHGCYGR